MLLKLYLAGQLKGRLVMVERTEKSLLYCKPCLSHEVGGIMETVVSSRLPKILQ